MAIGTSLLLAATPGYCDERGWGCEPVLEATDNEGLAAVIGWLSEKPLQILGILLAAWIANRVLRKLIKRSGERMMDQADRLGDFMPSKFRRAAPTGRAEARVRRSRRSPAASPRRSSWWSRSAPCCRCSG